MRRGNQMWKEAVWTFALIWPIFGFAEDTILHLYHPLTPKDPTTVVTAKKFGECWQQSQLIKREDAWRCIADGQIHDPCFVQPYGSHLEALCPESPWAKRGVQITVSSPLDNKQHETLDMSRTYPWAVELTNEEKCQAILTNEQYDNSPVRYHCEKNTVLIGHLQRCTGVWKILQREGNQVNMVKIKKAWF